MNLFLKKKLRALYQHLLLPAKCFYSWISQQHPKSPFKLPAVKSNLPDVLIFGGHQTPVAKTLAQKGHRVFYISNHLINQSLPNFDAKKLDKNLPIYLIHLALNKNQHLTLCLAKVFVWTGYHETLSVVEDEFWRNIALALPNNHVVNQSEVLQKISLPLVSIIVLSYNNLTLTKECLESIEKYTNYLNYEVIIVDNASTDGTQDYLKKYFFHHTLILNTENKGAMGNNCGIKASRGEYIVFLSNDTLVTPGWLTTMVNHFKRNPQLGLLGPVTNNIGNEAKINVSYIHPRDMFPEVQKITANSMGKLFRLKALAFFCVMMPRKIIEQVGVLDEQFSLGYFEDDDYCHRVEAAGYIVCCADDVFIHHYLSATYGKMRSGAREALFENNKKLYEVKWGPWEKHHYREELHETID
jgi:GT2 family glycosyltransferase